MKNRHLFLFALILIFASHSHASPPLIPGCIEQTVHQVEGQERSLCWMSNIEGWVSPDCIKKSSAAKCGSLMIHQLVKSKPFRLDASDLKGGKNPGTVICTKIGGKVKYSTQKGGSQSTFCEAKDRSLIDSNSLTNAYYPINQGKE